MKTMKFLSVIGIVGATVTPPPPASPGEAAFVGDIPSLRGFLQNGLDVDETEAIGFALLNNHLEVYRFLRDFHGADVSYIRGPSRRTVLHCAVQAGEIDAVREILNDGSYLEAGHEEQLFTPLMLAIRYGRTDIFRELISRGANIHAVDASGYNTIMLAIRYRHREIASELIALGVEVNARHNSGRRETPLLMAISAGGTDVATALVEAGANVDDADHQGTTPLISAVQAGSIDIVRMLIAHHADVTRVSSCNGKYSALSAAATSFHSEKGEIIRIIIQEGRADPNMIDQDGLTVLHRVAYGGIRNVARLLIENGASTEIRDAYGRTPQEAAQYRLEENRRYPDFPSNVDEEWVAEFAPLNPPSI